MLGGRRVPVSTTGIAMLGVRSSVSRQPAVSNLQCANRDAGHKHSPPSWVLMAHGLPRRLRLTPRSQRMETRMLTFSMAVPRMCAAAVLMLILAPGLARAQEVTKGWHTYATTGGQPLPTERDAQRVIEASFEMYQQFGAFSWEVRDQTILEDKTIYAYRVKPQPMNRSPWKYRSGSRNFDSEEQLLS
jgi:predicted DNA-binding transcriptional regulator